MRADSVRGWVIEGCLSFTRISNRRHSFFGCNAVLIRTRPWTDHQRYLILKKVFEYSKPLCLEMILESKIIVSTKQKYSFFSFCAAVWPDWTSCAAILARSLVFRFLHSASSFRAYRNFWKKFHSIRTKVFTLSDRKLRDTSHSARTWALIFHSVQSVLFNRIFPHRSSLCSILILSGTDI